MPIVEKLHNSGFLISDVVNNQLVIQRYFGYTKRESLRMFKEEFKEKKDALQPRNID